MRSWILVCLVSAALVPAYGDDLTFTLDSNSGSGSPAYAFADAGNCIPANCVLFTGTLLDTDTDGSLIFLNSSPPGISVTFSSGPASGSLSVDNTFFDDVPFVLSGDPDWATDDLGNPPNSYTGPLFGIDIAPGTSLGEYAGIITISAAGGLLDPNYTGFIVTQDITVEVAPEPSAAALALAGLLVLVGLRQGYPRLQSRFIRQQ